MSNLKVRRYCLTLNNYTEEEKEFLINVFHEAGPGIPGVRYFIAGDEIGESGTPHLQCYIELCKPTRVQALKNMLQSDRYHVESCKGSAEQNITYCSKEKVLCTWGKPGNQGQRTDIEQACATLRDSDSILQVAEEHPVAYVKFHRGLRSLQQALAKPRDWTTELWWFYGETGTGKSRAAFEYCKNNEKSYCFIGDPTLQWADPYSGEEVVIIDDFASDAPITRLLRICDRYPLQLPIKGGWVQFVARVVIVTSNFPIGSTYGQLSQYSALLRRVTKYILFTGEGEQTDKKDTL